MTRLLAVADEPRTYDRPVRCECGQVVAQEKPDGTIRPVGEWHITIRGEAITVCPACHRRTKLPVRRCA